MRENFDCIVNSNMATVPPLPSETKDTKTPASAAAAAPFKAECELMLENKPFLAVHFKNIREVLFYHLAHCSYVIGCVAWITDFSVINAMSQLKGATLIVQAESMFKIKTRDSFKTNLKRKYQTIKQFPWATFAKATRMPHFQSLWEEMKTTGEIQEQLWTTLGQDPMAIRTCGQIQRAGHEGQNPDEPSMMHHKYLVFMDDNGKTLAVWTGSFNFTKNASKSLENVQIIYNKKVADAYLRNFLSLLPTSRGITL